jgi:hypothetical protein
MIRQRRAAMPVTELVLAGGRFDLCPKAVPRRKGAPRAAVGIRARAAAQRRKRAHGVVRRLWGDGKGHYRSTGTDASAGVRGTKWLTEDRCDGTLVLVRRGTVRVRDFVHHRTITVKAGNSYLAKRR